MTEFEKLIYNTYLRVSRQALNKPFKYRQNFDEMEGTEIEGVLKRLSSLFTSHKHIQIDRFFIAPYLLYSSSTPYYLDYYISQKAIKTYSLYIAKLKTEDPDTSSQLKYIVESFIFIKKFCADKGILPKDYCNCCTGVVNDFIPHLKEFNVSAYALFPFNDFDKNLLTSDIDTLKFILGEGYVDSFYVLRNKYLSSKKAKTLSELAYKKITN